MGPHGAAVSREENKVENKEVRILVVDDEEDILELVRYNLAKERYQVTSALSGEIALEKARAEGPDLILLDIQLPVMDGYAVARCLRTYPELVQTPIIAVTSYAMLGDREMCLQAGMDDYISKPVHLDTLTGALERAVAHAAPPAVPPRSGRGVMQTRWGGSVMHDGRPVVPVLWA